MKTVFSGNENVVAAFFSRNYALGRNPTNNIYFENNVIYSYGEHFPMARIINSETLVVTTDSYSVTTAGHLSAVRKYEDEFKHIFHVPFIMQREMNYENGWTKYNEKNLRYYASRYWEYMQEIKNITRRWKRLIEIQGTEKDFDKWANRATRVEGLDWRIKDIYARKERLLKEITAYINMFKVPVKSYSEILTMEEK